MSSSPLCSIIMTVYNFESYVAEAVESALKQSMQNFELIVVDDGSTDTSVDIVKSFQDNCLIEANTETFAHLARIPANETEIFLGSGDKESALTVN